MSRDALPTSPPPSGPPADPPEIRRFVSATDFLDRRDAQHGFGPATWGWRGAVRRLTGGLVSPRIGAAERAYLDHRRTIQRDFDGPRTIAFINPKGGAAKTTGVLAAGYTFGTVRGGGVVAWDNNETRGTLGIRGARGVHRNTTRELLADLERFTDVHQSRIGDLGAFVRSQGDAHFDVLASDERPDVTGMIRAGDFDAIHQLLERFYRVILVDTGNNMRAENWLAAAGAADLLVVTSTVREDTGYSGLWMLDALHDAGYQDLKRKTVTVLSDPSATVDGGLAADLVDVYRQRTREVYRVPYDPALVAGSVVPYDRLSRETRMRWLEACAGMAAALRVEVADPGMDSPSVGLPEDHPSREGVMRAVVYRQTGPSSVLEPIDREVPEPGPGEVRVRVVRAGVNPTDWKFRAGMMSGYDEVTPGQDGSGVVDAVGEDVSGLAVGDRVWMVLAQHGRAYGTAAEYTVQPAHHVVPLPDNADFDLGASISVPAVTAHRALTASEFGPARLGPGALEGRVVLVAGGAGAVGNAAIQLARWSGATVITTVSSDEKGALAVAAGAHHTVNYRATDAAEAIRTFAPEGVDIAVEVAPAQNIGVDLDVVKVHGLVSIYANNGGDEMTMPLRAAFGKNLRFQFVILYTLDEGLLRAALEDVSAAVAAGALRAGEDAGLPLHHYPLEQTAAAHDAVEGGAVGKVLLQVSAG